MIVEILNCALPVTNRYRLLHSLHYRKRKSKHLKTCDTNGVTILGGKQILETDNALQELQKCQLLVMTTRPRPSGGSLLRCQRECAIKHEPTLRSTASQYLARP
jgi:hypothetical protein